VKYLLVQHWLDGDMTLEYEFGSADWKERKTSGKWANVPNYGIDKSGSIGLQNAGKVSYRNVKIIELL
jgi:hypothetical protein